MPIKWLTQRRAGVPVDPSVQAARRWRSVSSEAAWRYDRLKLGEIQIADRLQCFGKRTVPQVFRQSIQPCGIFDLCFDETDDVAGPVLGAAAMIGREIGRASCRERV